MKKILFIILIAYISMETFATFSTVAKANPSVTDVEPAVEDNIGYLIVSTPTYREPIKKFMEWKRTLGFQVDTLLLDSTPLTNTQVLDSIQNRYNQNPHLAYLLIVGTTADVPTFTKSPWLLTGLFDNDNSYQSGEWEHQTDYDYGLVSQPNDIPLLKRGRIPVATAAEAQAVFDKIISYENAPVTDESFYNRGLHIAQFQDKTNDHYEDYRFTLTSEDIRNFMLGKGKQIDRVYTGPSSSVTLHWNHTVYANGQVVPDSVVSILDTPTVGDVSNKIDDGVLYVLYYDHGSENQWLHPQYQTSDIQTQANGNKLPLVISCCYHTGNFSSSNYFASTFLKKSGGGAIGVIASTNVILTGFSDSMLEGIFSSIWPENGIAVDSLNLTDLNPVNYTNRAPVYRLGDILDSGLSVMKQQFEGIELHGLNNIVATGDTATNMCVYASEIFHLIGDPTLELRTEMPQVFATPTVNVTGSNVHVATTNGEARISFYNQTTGAVNSYMGTSANYAYNGSDALKVSITRHNYIPYFIEIGGDIYIQDECIQGGQTYWGSNIYVGKNVNQNEPQGEVVFESGSNTTLKGNVVKLDKGTVIEKGATLTINN